MARSGQLSYLCVKDINLEVKALTLLSAFSVFGHVKSPVFESVSLTSTVTPEGQAPLTVGGVAVTPQSKCCVNLKTLC